MRTEEGTAKKKAASGANRKRLLNSKESALENVRRVVGQPRAFAARERHMPAVRPALEAIDDIREARTAFRQIRRIDLRDIAKADDLRARTGARDERLHLLRREVLRLVDDQILVDERAAAHEVHALDLQARADQLLGRRAAPFA